jgi:hypothetical protein
MNLEQRPDGLCCPRAPLFSTAHNGALPVNVCTVRCHFGITTAVSLGIQVCYGETPYRLCVVIDVPKDPVAFIFKGRKYKKPCPWQWRPHDCSKRRQPLVYWHSSTSQQTGVPVIYSSAVCVFVLSSWQAHTCPVFRRFLYSGCIHVCRSVFIIFECAGGA